VVLSRALLEAVLAAAPVGFALFDRELRFLQVNERLAELNRLPVHAHIGRTPMELLPWLPVEAYVQEFRRVLAGGQPVIGVEIEGVTSEVAGAPRSFREDWYPIAVEGEIVALAALVVETTEEKERVAERARLAVAEATAAERAQAANVLAAVGDGIFAADAAGVIEFANPAGLRLLGGRATGAAGRSLNDLLPGWDAVAARVPIAAEGTPSAAVTLPFEIDRHELWLSIGGVRFGDGVVYAFRDETDERLLEQMRSEFVTTLSHELRTPLAAVGGAVQTLRRQDVDFDRQTRESLLTIAVEQTERLAQIADRILLIGQVDAGALTLDESEVDVNTLVRALAAAYATAAPASLAVEAAETNVPPVRADPRRLESVVGCLIENAIKYTPDGGRVVVSAEAADGRVRIAVTDTGIGIAQHKQERVFEKFYRADPEQTRGIGGTGLGLYIARELTERMNGRISVHSKHGNGSTFTVDLPAA
jgi:two-component system sensor histidine kinase VicK